jgi:GntR family transcriptional regulator, transcriptional repressor for pyruvate dehydrogenase complex
MNTNAANTTGLTTYHNGDDGMQQPARLDAVTRAPLPQLIVERIRDYIAQHRLQAGDRLPPERVLMEQLGVGRSSVREAMKILTTMGLVEIRRGDGAYVASPDRFSSLGTSSFVRVTEKNTLHDIIELRRCIEPMAAYLAAERATDDDIADLEAILRTHEQRLAEQMSWLWEPLEFELAIAESTGNVLLVQAQETLRDLCVGLSPDFRRSVDHTLDWMHEHWVILSAIKGRNPTRARDAVLLHLDLERIERDLDR